MNHEDAKERRFLNFGNTCIGPVKAKADLTSIGGLLRQTRESVTAGETALLSCSSRLRVFVV